MTETITLKAPGYTQTFDIVHEGKHGWDVKYTKGRNTYTAIRNRNDPNFVTVISRRGRVEFSGKLV